VAHFTRFILRRKGGSNMASNSISKHTATTNAVCPNCGTLLTSLLKSGRCGCPECYRVFGDYLSPILLKRGGRHCGRVPLAVKREEYQIKVRVLEQKIAAAYAAGNTLLVERYSHQLRSLKEDV
jgi:protein-arginine kinase activator protein McsA